MLSRSSAVILSLTSLSAGNRAGDRPGARRAGRLRPGRGPRADGDARRPPRPQPAPAARRLAEASNDDDAIYDALAKQYEQFQQVNRTFELVAKAVSPAVVHIVAQKTIRAEEGRRSRQFEETGSGVIVRSDRATGPLRLDQSSRGRGCEAGEDPGLPAATAARSCRSKIWSDAKADIAVLKLDRDDLPAARLGNSDEAPVGSWVMALGSPFGLMHSVSQGIISARGRHMDELQDVENQDFLQTDAAINPGNSGGPLVNMKGEVIGINNSIASNGGGNEGVGFSIPINLARWIMNELIAHGRVTRGALGVDLHPEFRQEDAVDAGHGAAAGRLDRRGQPVLAGRQGGPARRRRRPPLRRGRDHRPEPPDQHGLDGPGRAAGRGGRLARPPRA